MFTIAKFNMTFLSSFIVVVTMFLLPIIRYVYMKLRKDDDNEGAFKLREVLGSNHLGRVFSVLISKSFPVFSEVTVTVR